MPSLISQPSLLEISIADKGASGDDEDRPRILIAKRDTTEKMMTLEDVLMSLPEEQKAVVMAALAEAAKPAEPMMPEPAPEMPAKAEGDPPAEEEEEKPEMPVPVAKALEAVSKEDRAAVLEAIEKRDVLEKRVAELEADKELAEFKEIAKSMDALPGQTTEQRAKTLIAAKKNLSAEDYEAFEKSLRGAAEIVAKGLSEVGSSATETGGAKERLEAIAKSLREADPKLTPAKARVEAARQNPDLYAQTR